MVAGSSAVAAVLGAAIGFSRGPSAAWFEGADGEQSEDDQSESSSGDAEVFSKAG